jgi:type VI secretion system protein ImpK
MSATIWGAAPSQPAGSPSRRRAENFAFLFQEILTVIVRLRSNRQPVTDAQKFRSDMRGALKKVERDAVARGYSQEDAQHAQFAVVVFLDESILNSSNPAFADWARMPLQEEFYGNQLGGEVFFQDLERAQARNDSNDVADLLEVYLTCLLLGYRGRYDISGQDSLQRLTESVAERIRRIRGPSAGLSPAWAVPEGAVATEGADPWAHRLLPTMLITVGTTLVLFVLFKVLLTMGTSSLRTMIEQRR